MRPGASNPCQNHRGRSHKPDPAETADRNRGGRYAGETRFRAVVPAGAGRVAALKTDWLDARRRGGGHRRRSPRADVAADEDYWREIQQAFTLDRTIINLNNG